MPASFTIPELFSVAGLVCVITGGGTGIGLMMATALESNGAIVYIIGRRLEVLERAAQENNTHGNIIPLQGDVTDRDSLLRMAAEIERRHGFVNLLIANAALSGPIDKPPADALLDIRSFQQHYWNVNTESDFAHVFETNVTAVYFTALAFLPLLHEGNKRTPLPGVFSQIIVMSSGAAHRTDDQNYTITYSVSKAALLHMAKILASMLRRWDIRCNLIAPGIYRSEMTETHGIAHDDPYPENVIPMRRLGTEKDIGGLILFLASSAGAYVNRCIHFTDGGRLMLFPANY